MIIVPTRVAQVLEECGQKGSREPSSLPLGLRELGEKGSARTAVLARLKSASPCWGPIAWGSLIPTCKFP